MSRQSHIGRKLDQISTYLTATQRHLTATPLELELEGKFRASSNLEEKVDILMELLLSFRERLTPTTEERDLLQDPEAYPCVVCQSKYTTRSHLHRHIQSCRDESHRALNRQLSDLRCNFENCEREFTTRDGLTKHKQWHRASDSYAPPPSTARPDNTGGVNESSGSRPFPPPFLEPPVWPIA